MFTRPLSIAALSQTAPYDTFLFRSAARPGILCGCAVGEAICAMPSCSGSKLGNGVVRLYLDWESQPNSGGA